MNKLFFETVQQKLQAIMQQMGDDTLSSDERARLGEKAQGFVKAINHEYQAVCEELKKSRREQRRIQFKNEQLLRQTTKPPTIDHYRHMQAAGGDADFICRAIHHAGIHRIERLKILRTLFGFSLEEARAVDDRNSD